MNREAVNFLHNRAKTLGKNLVPHIRHHDGVTQRGGNDWIGYKGEDLDFELLGEGSIIFRRRGHGNNAWIKFSGVCPVKIEDEVLHEPRVIGKKKIDAQSTDFYNDTSAEQTRIYKVNIETEQTMADDIGVSVALGFQQQLSAGGQLAFSQAVFTFSQQITTNYNKHLETRMSKAIATETEIVIPPKKKVTVTTERSIGTLEQDLEYWCDLDYQTEILSQDDFHVGWRSNTELKQMLRGLGETGNLLLPNTIHTVNAYREFYKSRPPVSESNINAFFPGKGLHFKTTSQFTEATTGSVRVKESNL